MSSRTLTTWLLIAGPIGVTIGFTGWGAIMGFDVDSSDSQAMIKALGGNIDGVKPFLMVAMLGYLSIVAGLAGVKSSMDGGSGHSIAGVGVLLLVIGSAGAAIEGGLQLATGEAGSQAAQAAAAGAAESAATLSSVAAAAYASSVGIGATTTALAMLGFGIIGVGILVQKNLHTAIGALIVVVGVIGTILAAVDYTNQLMGGAYILFMALSVTMGIITLRSQS